jgi:hypothetical protein
MVDMPEELAGILLQVAWPYRRAVADCRFNRLKALANFSGWRRIGTLIAVENRRVSSNLA